MPDFNHHAFKSQFLIAMPLLVDPDFIRSVICVCEHNRDGAMGIIINRIHPDLTARDIFEELGIATSIPADQIPVYLGGPVHPDDLFILHGPPFVHYGSLLIGPQAALSNTEELLRAIAAGQGPRQFMITLGCTGWGPGQLEQEICSNVWLSTDLATEILFEVDVEQRWNAAVRQLGFDPLLLSHQVGHA